jgi:hypothetical protein
VILRSTDVRGALKSRQRGFLLNPYRFGGPPAALDGLTTLTGCTLWSATSFRKKLLSAYGGDARSTRRSAGGSQAIGFVGNNVDLAGEVAYVGATPNDGWVESSYDHSGNSNHFSQATTTAQPRTVLDGVSESFGYSFAETDEALISDNNSGSVAAIAFFLKLNQHTTGGTQVLVEHTVDINSNDGFYVLALGGALRVGIGRSGSFLIHDYSETVGGTGCVLCARFDISEATNTNRAKLYKDGVLLTPSSTPLSSSMTGNFANAKFHVGARAGTSLFAGIRVEHIVAYTGTGGPSDGEVAAVSGAIA